MDYAARTRPDCLAFRKITPARTNPERKNMGREDDSGADTGGLTSRELIVGDSEQGPLQPPSMPYQCRCASRQWICRCGQTSVRAEFYFRFSRQRLCSAGAVGRQGPIRRAARRMGPCHCGRTLSWPVSLSIPTGGRGPKRRDKPCQPAEGRGSPIHPRAPDAP